MSPPYKSYLRAALRDTPIFFHPPPLFLGLPALRTCSCLKMGWSRNLAECLAPNLKSDLEKVAEYSCLLRWGNLELNPASPETFVSETGGFRNHQIDGQASWSAIPPFISQGPNRKQNPPTKWFQMKSVSWRNSLRGEGRSRKQVMEVEIPWRKSLLSLHSWNPTKAEPHRED